MYVGQGLSGLVDGDVIELVAEGGMADHASQISRVLGVPCITGTGNASRVLKDGDIVEITAKGENGVAVKCIK